jgi:hypothetical protein
MELSYIGGDKNLSSKTFIYEPHIISVVMDCSDEECYVRIKDLLKVFPYSEIATIVELFGGSAYTFVEGKVKDVEYFVRVFKLSTADKKSILFKKEPHLFEMLIMAGNMLRIQHTMAHNKVDFATYCSSTVVS